MVKISPSNVGGAGSIPDGGRDEDRNVETIFIRDAKSGPGAAEAWC